MCLRGNQSWLLIFLLSLALFLPGLGAYPLLDPDEGRNAQVALEMVNSGHWIPPTLKGEIRYQKPPLYYWLVASTFLLIGPGEFAARLPSALAAIMGVWITLLLGTHLWGREKGYIAALVQATSLIYVGYAHIVIFDMLLTTFILASLFFSWKALEEGGKESWAPVSLFAALAFLTKGPIGLVIPLMVLLPIILSKTLVDKEKTPIPWMLVILVFLVIAAPPFILAELKNPGYCYRFFWEENVLRYFTPRFHRGAPFYYYLPVIILGLLPWTFFLPRTLTRLKALWRLYPHRTLFLASWIVLPTLFFTLSKSKMPHYILPTFPAWALLMAGTWKGNKGLPLKVIIPALIIYILGFTVAMPIYSARKSAAFAAPLMVKSQRIPIYSYKAGRSYSLLFYTGRNIQNFQELEDLEETLKTIPRAYVFTKASRLKDLQDLPGFSVKVLGTTPKYALVLVKSPTKPGP